MSNIFSQLKAPKNEVESQVGVTTWLTDEDIKEIESVGKTGNKTTMLDVYEAMKEIAEGTSVYLDNVDLEGLNITEQQFAGFCSSLTKAGLYSPIDKFFGRIN